MDGIFGDKVGRSELQALRTLLETHVAVGVDFIVDVTDVKAFATVTLVWPAGDEISAPWVMSERVIGRPQFLSLMRTLFLEDRATKVLHRVSMAAHWMATHGLPNAVTAARNVFDLQLFYEHAVDPRARTATLPEILEAVSGKTTTTTFPTTTQALYRSMLSEQLSPKQKKTSLGNVLKSTKGPLLTHMLLQHSVQRAHLCLVCFDRLLLNTNDSPETLKNQLIEFTHRRMETASYLPPGHELIWFIKSAKFHPRSVELLGDHASMQSMIPHVKRYCDIEMLLALLPPSLYESIVAIDRFEDRLVAISLDVGSRPKAYVISKADDRETECIDLYKSSSPPTPSKLFGAFRKKPHEVESELSHDDVLGILALAGGERAIDKSNRVCVDRQLHRIAVVRSKTDQVVGLTMRVGRTVQFASNVLMDLLHNTELRSKSVLVLGGSGAGKTSLLRDIARCLSAGRELVGIVDTTNDIGGDGAIMHRSVDRATRLMVKSLDKNAGAIIECVQNHVVDTLVVDEVTNNRDVRALAFGKNHCRRRVIAGCAIRDLPTLVQDYNLNGLTGGMQSVASKPSGKYQDELDDGFVMVTKPTKPQPRERVTLPVMDVIVELNAARVGEYRIVWDVSRAVDDILAGRAYAYETRIQTTEILGIQVVTK